MKEWKNAKNIPSCCHTKVQKTILNLHIIILHPGASFNNNKQIIRKTQIIVPEKPDPTKKKPIYSPPIWLARAIALFY